MLTEPFAASHAALKQFFMMLMGTLRLFMLFESYQIITVQKHRQKTYGLFRKLTKEMRGVFCQACPTISRSQRQTPQ